MNEKQTFTANNVPGQIVIRQVANGYIVEGGTRDYNALASNDSTRVFQTMADLTYFIEAHFTHRCSIVQNDPQP